jgi:hypothetical protein
LQKNMRKPLNFFFSVAFTFHCRFCSHCTFRHHYSLAYSPFPTTIDTFCAACPLSPPSFSWPWH